VTRLVQVEMALRAVSSHALAITAWQRSGAEIPEAVFASSDALFRAALALADQPKAESEADDTAAWPDLRPCPHPPEARINFGAAGCSDFQCRLCGESVAVPHTAASQ
jgi:hypothetical protein